MLTYYIAIQLLIIALLMLKQLNAITQTIYPEKPNSIDPFRTNEGAYGNYTFHFRISTFIKEKPRFVITFPPIYTTVLKDPTKCFVLFKIVLQNTEINTKCTLAGNDLIIDLKDNIEDLDAGYFIVNLQDVQNPSSAANKFSGNFYITSWSGLDINIDSNLSFDTIAFAPAYSGFTSADVVNDGASTAGYLTNYLVKFGISKTYDPGTWFRLQFPSTFTIPNTVQCTMKSLNLPLNCTTYNNILFIKGLNATLAKDQIHILKIIGVTNPYAATSQTGGFLFESLKEGINTVIDQKDNIPGIKIDAGQVTDVLIIGFPLVQNLFVDYQIKFLITNQIPEGGSIKIVFPPTFQGLDKTCRVISGLIAAPGKTLSCVTNSLTISITGFSTVIPQYIDVKCYARNPPVGGPTPYFQISTFKDVAMTSSIDDNPNAGFVTISSIGKPNFVNFDYYTPLYNCTFSEICPIDFRLFPQIGNGLPKSSLASYSTIDLQIPHWWWLAGQLNQPECLFGTDSTFQCWQREHIFSIQSPYTRDFDVCDLPVSVKYAQVTPIPGRYPWRVLTYKNGGKWNSLTAMKNPVTQFATPLEQDTFIMEIPYLSISVLQAYASSSISGDPDNMLHIRCNLEPFDLSYEGAINLNFTHIEDNLVDRAAWPIKLGFAIADNSVGEYPCKVYINGVNVGIGTNNWNYHRKVRCYIKTGDSTKYENTYIQVVGFDRTLPKGNYFEIFFPNVKYCTTVNRQCKLTISYTNTQDLTNPYILNQREVVFGTVQNIPASPTFPNAIAGTATRTNDEKCQPTELRINFNTISSDIMPGDYVIFKRKISHWYFLSPSTYNVITPSINGLTMVAYPMQIPSLDQELIIIPITERIPAGANKLFRVMSQTTSPYANTYDTIYAVAYSNKNKIASGTLPNMNLVLDGGIIWQGSSLSDIAGNRNGFYAYGYNQPFQFSFDTCLEIPPGGEIVVKFATAPDAANFQSFDTDCLVWENVKYKYGNESHPICFWDAPSLSFKVQQFEQIPKKSRVTIQFYGKLQNSISAIQVDVNTYQIQNDVTTQIDYLRTTANTIAAVVPYTIAPKYQFVNWKEKKGGMYLNNRGYFKIVFDPGHDIDYNLAEDNYLEFVFDASITKTSNFDCRYGLDPNGHLYPSVQCDFITGAVYNSVIMRLHPKLHIKAGNKYQVIIDTRDKEIYEGLTFTKTGIYTLSVYSYVGGVKQRSGKGRFEVFGRKIPHFFIYSSNKVIDDWTLITLHSEWYLGSVALGASDTTKLSYQMMVVFFETANNGFAQDLGTGLPELESFPCRVIGVNLPATKTNVDCTLYYGYNNAPAKIEITGYSASNPSDIFVHLPLIKNPASIVVPKIWFEIQSHTFVGGVKQINVLWEGHYTELNMTYTKHPSYTYSPVSVDDATVAIQHDQKTLERKGILTLPIRTTGITLNANDVIAFKFPLYWPLDVGTSLTDCYNIPVANCYTITNVDQDYHMLVVQLKGNVATGNTLKVNIRAPIAVVPTSPPAPENIITTYIFHHTRLVRIVNLKNFSKVNMVPDEITTYSANCDYSPIEGQQTNYIVKFQLPHELLAAGQLRIDAYDYTQVVPFCSNTPNSLLTGNLNCGVNGNYAYLDSFDYLYKDKFIEIKIPFTNPAYNAANNKHKFKVSAYFKASSGFFYLKSTSGDFIHVSPYCDVKKVSAIGAANTIWTQMYHEGNFTRTGSLGPINFLINFSQSFTIDNTYYVIVKIPIAFVLQTAQFVAIWNDDLFARKWSVTTTATHNEFTVYFPKTGSIAANTQYKLTVTTLNAQNNQNGFTYPNTQGVYYAPVEFYISGVLTSSSQASIYVWKTSPTQFEARAAVINKGEKNLFYIGLTLNTILQSGSVLKVKLPVVSYSDMNALNQIDEDGGTDKFTGNTVSCYFTSPVVAFVPTCTFTRGNKLLFQPVEISVTGITSSIAANQKIILLIDGIKNPSSYTDNNHVYTSVEVYYSGTHLSTGIDYDFTLVTDPFVSYTNLLPPTFNSDVIGNTNIQMTITFTCSVALDTYSSTTGKGFGDYLIVEFPDGYVLKILSNTEGRTSAVGSAYTLVDVGPNNNILLYRPDRNLIANTVYSLYLRKFDQAIVKPLNAVFTVSCVKQRSIVTKNIYNPVTTYIAPTVDPTLIIITPSDAISSVVPQTKHQKWTIQYQIPPTIPSVPSTGLFDIIIPASLTNPDLFCENDPTSSLINASDNAIYCKYDSTNTMYTITNFNDIVPGQNIVITFYAVTPVTGTIGNIIIRAYKDKARQFMLMETPKAFPTVGTPYGFSSLKIMNQYGKKDVIRINSVAPFSIKVRLPAGWSLTSYLEFQFDETFVGLPNYARLDCYFDEYEASLCSVITLSPLKIRVNAPNEPTLVVSTWYTISITPKCGDLSENGFQYLNFGTTSVSINYLASSLSLAYEILPPDFTFIEIRSLFSNKVELNALYFKVRPANNIPTGGTVVVTLPLYSQDSSRQLWTPNASFSNGQYLTKTCSILSTTTLVAQANTQITCQYFVDAQKMKFVIGSFQSVSAGVDIEFSINDLSLFAATDENAMVDLIVETLDATSSTINKRYVTEMMGIVIRTTTSVNKALNLNRNTKNTLEQTNVQYTFSSVDITKAIDFNSSVVFAFSNNFLFLNPISNCNAGSTPGSYLSFGRYIVFTPSSTIAVGNYNFCMGGLTNPKTNYSGNLFVYVVYSRSFLQKLIYTCPSFTANPLVVAGTSTTLSQGLLNFIDLTLDTDTALVIDNYIRIDVPTSIEVINYELYAGLTSMTNFKNTISGATNQLLFILTENYSKVSKGVLKVKILIKNPAAGSYSITASIGESSTVSSQISTGTYSMTVSALTVTMQCKQTSLFDIKSTSVDIKFTTSVSSTATSAILTAASFSNIGTCSDASGTVSCSETSTGVFTASSLTDSSQVTYNLETPSASGLSIFDFRLSSTNICPGMIFFTEESNFSSFSFSNLHNNIKTALDMPTIWDFTFSPAVDILSSEYLSIDVFNHDNGLANSLSFGSKIPCVLTIDSNTHDNALCVIQITSSYLTRISVQRTIDISSSSTVNLVLYRVYNPTVVTTVLVVLRHYKFLIGNKPTEIQSDTGSYTTSSATITRSTKTAVSVFVQAGDSPTITFTNSFGSSDSIFIFGTGLLCNKHSGDLLSLPTDSNYYASNCATESTNLSGSSLSITNIEYGISASTQSIYALLIQDAFSSPILKEAITIPLTLTKNSFTSVTVTQMSVVNSIITYRFVLTISKIAPKRSYIEILFPTPFSSMVFVALSGIDLSKVSGTITGSSDGIRTIYLKGYDYISSGLIDFSLSISARVSGSTWTTGAITIKSELDSTIIFEKLSQTIIYSYIPPITALIPNNFISNNSPLYASQVGRMETIISFKSTLAATDLIYIYPDASFPISSGRKFNCKFKSLVTNLEIFSETSSFNPIAKRFEISMPISATIASNVLYLIELYSFDDMYRGITAPATSASYVFSFQVVTSTSTVKEQFKSSYPISTQKPSYICFKNYVSNPLQENILTLRYQPKTAIPSSAILYVSLSTQTILNGAQAVSLAPGLKQTYLDQQTIGCRISTMTLGSTTRTTISLISKCQIQYGSANELHRPVRVKIVLSGSLSSSSLYQIDIYNIYNPSLTQKFVSAWLEVWSSTSIIESLFDKNILYTTNPSYTTETAISLGSKNVVTQSTFSLTIPVNTASSVNLKSDEDAIFVDYNTEFYKSNILTTTTTLDLHLHNANKFFFIPLSLVSTNLNIDLQNLYTGLSEATFPISATVWIVTNKLIRNKISYTGSFTSTTVAFTSVSVVSTNYLENAISNIDVTIVFPKDISSNGCLVFDLINIDYFKPGFVEVTSVLGSSVIWALQTNTQLIVRRINAIAAGTTVQVKVSILSKIISGQKIQVTAYNDYPGTLLAVASTIQSLTGSVVPGFPYLEATTFERPNPIRGAERGPLTFSITPTVTLTKRTDSIQIVVDPLFTVTNTWDFYCSFDNMISTFCYCDTVNNAFIVYAPRENNLLIGKTYTLKINAIRQVVFASNLRYIAHPIPATYNIKANFFKGATNSGTSTQISYVVPPYRWTIQYMNTFLVQKNGYSIYRLQVKNSRLLLGNKAGRIVIDFPTLGPYGRVFNDNLGTSYYHGQSFDCLSGSTSTITFDCYIFFGNGILPSSIIIYPIANMVIPNTIEVFLAPLLNPSIDMTEVKLTISGQLFDSVNLVWYTIMEYYDYIFVAMDIPISVVSKPMPVFSPNNQVGEKSSVTFNLNADAEIKTPSAGGFDRIVMTVDKSQLVLLNKQSVVALKLLCPGWTINIYNSQSIIEFASTSTIAQGTNINLSCTTMFNQQYVIPGGVSYTLDIFSNGYIAKRYVYASNLVSPNKLVNKAVNYKNIDLEVSTFDTYDFKLKPFNKVPASGFLTVEFSDQFTDISNCEIYGGITGVCIVDAIPGNKVRVRLALKYAYDPATDNDIFFKVDLTNPATPGTYDFTFVSYYNYNEILAGTNNAKIDEELIISYTYAGTTPFDYFSFDTPFSWTKECCPHNGWQFGVFQFKVAFSQPLTFDNGDKITVQSTNVYMGDHRTNYRELLCYFDKDDVQYSIKSEQCVANGDTYTILIPEELTLTPTNDLLINIEYRGTNRGVVSSVVPRSYYFIITTNNANVANEVAIVEFPIRACYFNNVNIDVVHWHQDLWTTLEFRAYTDKQINFRPNTDGQKFRFELVFSTWNEIKVTQYMDMGYSNLLSFNDAQQLPCYMQTSYNGYVIDGIYNPQQVYCEFYKGNTPSLLYPLVGTINSITDIATLDNFRGGFGPFKNYQVTDMDCYSLGFKNDGNRNTHTHVTLKAQVLMSNGQYTDVHSVTQWFCIQHIKSYLDVTTLPGGTANIDDLTFSLWHSTYTMRIDFGSTISADYIYYDIDSVHSLKFRNNTDVSRTCSHTCNFYPANSRRYLFYFFSSAATTALTHYSFAEAPSYAHTANTKLYVTSNHALTRYITGTVKTGMVVPDMILENDYPDNPVNAHIPYRLAVYFNSPFTYTHKYMRYYIPSVFTGAQNCKVKFGFTPPDPTNPTDTIKCRLTPGTTFRGRTYTLMEFYNINHWTATWRANPYENQFIVEVWLTNPSTPMWSPEWHLEWFDNYDIVSDTYDSTRQQLITYDNSDKARFWIGESVPITNYFRVYRNRHTFEERRQLVNEWAELHLRLYPAVGIPQDIGLVEINLPRNYDIPDGGTKICEVGHKYHKDLDGQFCEITNERKIRVRTSPEKGLDMVCTIVRITTEDSVGNLNGFQAPPVWGDQSADVFLWKDTQLLEYTSSDSLSLSNTFEIGKSLNISCTLNEINELSTLKIQFSVDTFINSGYDDDPKQTDLFLKKPISYFELHFNTYDRYNVNYNGFPFTLGYATPMNIPCQAIKNIYPKENENLVCKIETILTSRDYYIPVKLVVENFQSIELGTTNIEFHILDMTWTGDANNVAWVEFSIKEKKGDGTITTRYEPTRVNLLSQASTGVVHTVAAVDPLFPSLLPNTVGAKISFEFGFQLSSYLIEGDTIELQFPSHFAFAPQTDLSAIIHAQNTIENKFKTIEVIAYPLTNKLTFSVPQGFTILGCTALVPCKVLILLAGFRNAAYAFTSSYSLNLRVLGRKVTLIKLDYNNITPPTVSSFNSLLVTHTSEFSGDINVTYKFIFVPSYKFPANTKLTFNLNPTLFGNIHLSNPPALCSTNFDEKVLSCVISSAQINIVLSDQIEENFQGLLTLTGVKNPTYTGETPANSFVLTATHPSTFPINTGVFNSLTYKPRKNVGIVFIKIESSSYYKTIESDYTLVFQNTNKLPASGYINVLLPSVWALGITSLPVVDRILGSFTDSTLVFSQSIVIQPNGDRLLKIVTQFEWPAKGQVKIKISKVQNPTADITPPFVVTTIYDSVTIDMSDIQDPDAKVSYIPYSPKMSLVSFDFTPMNEAELSDYKIVLTSKEDILKNSNIQIIFSKSFEQVVTEPLRKLLCRSDTIKIDTCWVDTRIVSFNVLNDIKMNSPFDVTIYGIMNPNANQDPKISIAIKYQGEIIQFTNNLISLKTTQGPKHHPLTVLKTTSIKLLEKTTYTFGVTINDQIPKDAKILIDFPKQFELKDNTYNCTLGNLHDSKNLPYNVSSSSESLASANYNNLRRIEISGHTSAFPGGQISSSLPSNTYLFSYQINSMENAKDAGESFNFQVRVYDPTSRTILYRTSGILEYPSTIVYIQSGLKIFVSDVEPIPLGLMSKDVTVTLERSVPYDVYLIPSSPGFTFEPAIIDFKFYLAPVNTFRINPSNTTVPGTYKISWKKIENIQNLPYDELMKSIQSHNNTTNSSTNKSSTNDTSTNQSPSGNNTSGNNNNDTNVTTPTNNTNSTNQVNNTSNQTIPSSTSSIPENKFSEVSDTYFDVISSFDVKSITIGLEQNVYKCSLNAQTLPIKLSLSQPSSKPFKIYYRTVNPSQEDQVSFEPNFIEVNPGDISSNFTIKAGNGAISGLVEFSLDPEFQKIFYMPSKQLNLEILPADDTPPVIIDMKTYYITSNSAKFRISVNENAKVYYLVTRMNTPEPAKEELLDPAKRNASDAKPSFPEYQGSKFVNISDETSSYIYNDVYEYVTGLEEDTNYIIYALPVDLNGNIGEIKSLEFKTSQVEDAVSFKLRSNDIIDENKLLNALSLVSGLLPSQFKIIKKPLADSFNKLPDDIKSSLRDEGFEYEIQINPDITVENFSPMEVVREIDDMKESLYSELPELDPKFNIGASASEVHYSEQRFTYTPYMVDVSTYHATFNVSTINTGNIYGIILKRNKPRPTIEQIKYGLDSRNRRLKTNFYVKTNITVDTTQKYKVWPSTLMNFTFLYHTTRYDAYFIAENDRDYKNQLMKDVEMKKVSILTKREIFIVDPSKDYVSDS